MELDIFIAGEIVDLCIPTREFALSSEWYMWFNRPGINRFLDQGLFPNDPSQQAEFFERESKSRILLIISNRKNYLGVVSLSHINLIKKQAHLAIVIDSQKDLKHASFIALEAVARICEHGFLVMGLNRIFAGQHHGLANWQQRMEILGFRLEGIHRGEFVKGREMADTVFIAVTHSDYLATLEKREAYWDSLEKMKARVKRLPKKKFVDHLREFLAEEGERYYREVFSL